MLSTFSQCEVSGDCDSGVVRNDPVRLMMCVPSCDSSWLTLSSWWSW